MSVCGNSYGLGSLVGNTDFTFALRFLQLWHALETCLRSVISARDTLMSMPETPVFVSSDRKPFAYNV